MYATFNAIKKKNPNVTTIMYLNSMFDFSMYNIAGLANELEAKGTRILLRDKHDKIVYLCNDGNYYCNVTNFDWSKQAAKDLWMQEVANATSVGGVDGIFADHASSMLKPADKPKLCNGAGSKRTCWEFTPEHAAAFNKGHKWLVNHTQDILAKLGGPVVDGPYSRWGINPCDPIKLNQTVQNGKRGTGPYVLEVSRGACTPTESCLASFLLVAQEFSYLTCFSDEPTLHQIANLTKPLGAPLGDAIEIVPGTGQWTRRFTHGAIVRYDTIRMSGTVQWPGDPVPPTPLPPTPPPPPSPPPAYCGVPLKDTGMSESEISSKPTSSAGECCALCKATKGCVVWAWHAEIKGKLCHLHTATTTRDHKKGCTSGYINGTAWE
jgi:hypothetical protein